MFSEGQIFTGDYPSDAAVWANETGGVHIEEISPDTSGQSRWQIVKNALPSVSDLAGAARRERDSLLRQTDFLLMPDYPIEPTDLEAVRAYRQALRNVPQQEEFPIKVLWPELPRVLREKVD